MVKPHVFTPTQDLTPMAVEGKTAMQIEIDTTEEEMNDWADSNLYKFVAETHT